MNSQRFVLTGAPSCGKTTLINRLEELGYKTVPEAAREILENEGATSFMDLQYKIIPKQIERERSIFSGEIFYDRGLPDVLAYSKSTLGYFHSDFFQDYQYNRYSKVFILDRLPLIKDGIRIENDEDAQRIHEALLFTYNFLGYKTEIVPVLPIEDRVKFILGRIK